MKFRKAVFWVPFTIGLLFIIYSIRNDILENKKYSHKDVYMEEFNNVLVKGPNSSLRGSILVEDYGYIRFSSPLHLNPDHFNNWNSHAPIISFEKHSYTPKLWDVPFPYYLSKEQNSDTLVVQKDRFRLYFRMDTSD